MKIVGIIPARYKSTRFEGKPLADIYGKPMIWWTYNQVLKVKELDDVYVATDDRRIKNVCEELCIKCILTSKKPKMMLERIKEVSDKIDADVYLSIAGDEPLIEPEIISKIIKEAKKQKDNVLNLRTEINNPIDLVNNTTMKIVTDMDGYALYASRSPIPYPKSSLNYKYYKHMGTYALTKRALDFFVEHKKGKIELIEDFDLLRFLEYGMKVKILDVKSSTISVDTPKDIERVKQIINKRNKLNKI